MFKATWILLFSLCSHASLFANMTAQDFPKFKEYAKSLGSQPLDVVKKFQPETVFKNYNANPEAQRFYESIETEKTDLTAESSNALKDDSAGKVVIDNFGKNQFEINQNNEAIQHATLIEDESYAITHGVSNDKINCDAKEPICEVKSHVETCFTSHLLNKECTQKRIVSVTADEINQTVNVEVVIAKKWTGVVTVNLETGAILNASGGHVSQLVQLTHSCQEMRVLVQSIRNNGKDADWARVVDGPTCANHGVLTLNITKKWDRIYPIQIALTVHAGSFPYIKGEHWESSCSDVESKEWLCQLSKEVCTDENSTYVINGLTISRDCWEKRATFSCLSAKVDECAIQKEKKCLQVSSHCDQIENNTCIKYAQTYNCFDKVCTPPVNCIKNLFCADGNCTEHAGTQNEDFGKDIIPIAVAGEAGSEYAKTKASLFSGKAIRCKIIPLDFVDCCSDEGWGEKLNLTHCPEEDLDLGRAKTNYLAHYLGKYCAERVLGACVEHKRTYCVFDTKMARIIQEEGRLKQLNQHALGTAENPTCGGMSVEELQSLDMGRIEFLKPEYPFGSGNSLEAAGIVVLPPSDGFINEEVIRRIQKKVEG